jgi:phosphotransferase system enzyme I (PtsP)
MFHPRPVILRTLDIGGDKPLPYFPIEESNPFLGWRGIRISLDHPEIFLTQVRAMLRAAVGQKNLRIMLPMITHVNEVVDAKALILQAVDELQKEGYRVGRPKIGVMIEVPAAIFQAATLAKMVDFVSLGTNDLTQYLLAVDRNNPRVADLYDDMHPALLGALMQVMREVRPHLTDISVCGEMAGNPLSAILLVGMGYNRLSMSAGSLLRVKYVLRRITSGFAQHLLNCALRCDDAQAVHDLMEGAMQEVGLLQMIQPSGQRLSGR